jgi:biotin operon repressor
MHEDSFDQLVGFFKALSDRSRLRIVGLLAEKPRTGQDLADLMGLGAPTVSHHLRRLVDAGLVSVVPDQYYRVYSLREDVLQEMLGRLSDRRALRATGGDVPYYSLEAKVLADFMENGRLKAIPRQRKKRELILSHFARQFEAGREYSEAEVNDVLGRYHEDVATLRRDMIGYGMLVRDQGVYNRPE